MTHYKLADSGKQEKQVATSKDRGRTDSVTTVDLSKGPISSPKWTSPVAPTSRKVALYVRISTADGRQELENQLIPLRQYVERQVWEVYREYTDKCSGGTADRPGLRDLMKDGRARRFKSILVVKLDRFGRSVRDLANLLAELQEFNISFIAIDQGLDTSTSTGRLQANIIASVAEFERELIRERVKAGLQRARSKGLRIGRPRKIDHQKVLELRLQNKSLSEIAEELGCHKSTISKVLKNHPHVKPSIPIHKSEVEEDAENQ